jgi:acyl-CoA reductase-like NAD-dependent aldehyde dehydrogenase
MPPVPASPVPPRLAPDAEPTSDAPPRRGAPELRTYPILDSATDEPLGSITATDDADVREAVGRAADVAPAWAATPVARRAAVLRGWADALRTSAVDLAASITAETGALARDARVQVEAGIDAIERYAVLGALHRDRLAVGEGSDELVERVPRGVVAVLLPWRDPVALACAQTAACLVTGNTVVVKPSGRAPLSVTRAVRLIAAPPDVVVLLHGGAETGSALTAADEVDMVLHTGSVESGQTVAAACATRLGAAIVERGGKCAVIVDRDADPDACAEYTAAMAFSHGGQLCGSVDRLLVHSAVHDRFVAALLSRTERMRCGPGFDPGSTLGPLIDARQRATVHGQVTAAVAEGARLRTGGALPHGPGCFYPPTVLDGVRPTMAVWSQKTFGPVAAVMPFDHFGDALRIASDGAQRGGISLFSRDAERRERAAHELDGAAIDGDGVVLRPADAIDRLRRASTGLGDGTELLDELTRWQVTHRSS